MRRLSGFDADVAGDDQAMPDATTLDETVQPSESYQIRDADSSQQVAIPAAKRGLSAVIEGPPGTGKSQTITNIIAECLAEGKTVLFVAEKAAALAVVKRRLEAADLGDFMLELHSHKANKRSVLDELQRTLTAFEQPIATGAPDPQTLEISRARLNTQCVICIRPSVRWRSRRLRPLGVRSRWAMRPRSSFVSPTHAPGPARS